MIIPPTLALALSLAALTSAAACTGGAGGTTGAPGSGERSEGGGETEGDAPARGASSETPDTDEPSSGDSQEGSSSDTPETPAGKDGWACGMVNGFCYCDNVNAPSAGGFAACPAEFTCCIRTKGGPEAACECSPETGAACDAFRAKRGAYEPVNACP